MTRQTYSIENIYMHINKYNLNNLSESQECFNSLKKQIDFSEQKAILDNIKSSSDMLDQLKKDLSKLYSFLDL